MSLFFDVLDLFFHYFQNIAAPFSGDQMRKHPHRSGSLADLFIDGIKIVGVTF